MEIAPNLSSESLRLRTCVEKETGGDVRSRVQHGRADADASRIRIKIRIQMHGHTYTVLFVICDCQHLTV